MLTFQEGSTTKETTLNDIPKGTVFYGTVFLTDQIGYRADGYTGIWLKTNTTTGRHNVHAVSLTDADPNNYGPVVAVKCERVINYRVLKNPKIVESA